MINKIKIFDLSSSIRTSYKENAGGYNSWISTVDEEDRRKISRLKKNFLTMNPNFKFFCQFFYDWSDEDSEGFIKNRIESEGPQKKQIQNIITFIKENLVNSDVVYNLGINCYAGISRSTAIGIISWVLSGKPVKKAFSDILIIRPEAFPNLRILKFASEITGIDMFTPVKEWKEETKGTLYIPQGGYVW